MNVIPGAPQARGGGGLPSTPLRSGGNDIKAGVSPGEHGCLALPEGLSICRLSSGLCQCLPIKEYSPKERFSSPPPGQANPGPDPDPSAAATQFRLVLPLRDRLAEEAQEHGHLGVDAVHALSLALQTVGSELYQSRYHADGTLVWTKPGDGYGFPVASSLRNQLIGADRN